jgi:hypothetical protein
MTRLCNSLSSRQKRRKSPTTPTMQRLPAITHDRFSLFRFRSPLLTESRLLSLPVGTEMFHFPTFPPHALCVQAWVTGLFIPQSGFPIRKSSDHSSVTNSPRLIAGSYVLHRLLVPRHPPCALINLATKMLASTVQFSRYGRYRSPGPRLQLWVGSLRSATARRRFTGVSVRGGSGNARSLRTQQRAEGAGHTPVAGSTLSLSPGRGVLSTVARRDAN